jgi:hypothetical protein
MMKNRCGATFGVGLIDQLSRYEGGKSLRCCPRWEWPGLGHKIGGERLEMVTGILVGAQGNGSSRCKDRGACAPWKWPLTHCSRASPPEKPALSAIA